MPPAKKVVIDCAAFGARLYFDDMRNWQAAGEEARLAGDAARVAVCERGAEACRVAGRNALLQAGLPDDEAVDPESWVDLTPEEVEQRGRDAVEGTKHAAAMLRAQRNALLGQSDWTQLADAPLTPPEKAAWDAHRQALRDLPATTDPVDPVWPVPPVKGRSG